MDHHLYSAEHDNSSGNRVRQKAPPYPHQYHSVTRKNGRGGDGSIVTTTMMPLVMVVFLMAFVALVVMEVTYGFRMRVLFRDEPSEAEQTQAIHHYHHYHHIVTDNKEGLRLDCDDKESLVSVASNSSSFLDCSVSSPISSRDHLEVVTISLTERVLPSSEPVVPSPNNNMKPEVDGISTKYDKSQSHEDSTSYPGRSISFVMPILCRDLSHAHLVLSILLYQVDSDAIDAIWLIPDAPEVSCIQKLVDVLDRDTGAVVHNSTTASDGREKVKIMTVESLLPDLEYAVSPRNGYRIQMLTKLAIAQHLQTDFYVTLDTDIVFTRSMGYDDFVLPPPTNGTLSSSAQGRAITNIQSRQIHSKWYDGSARVLKLFTDKDKSIVGENVMGVTPSVLHRNTTLELLQHLSQLYPHRHWSVVLHDVTYKKYWTEYSLYFTFAKLKGTYDTYHDFSWNPKLYSSSSIWNYEQFQQSDWKEIFGSSDHYCVVTQQNKIFTSSGPYGGPEVLANRLREYLPHGSIPQKLITYKAKRRTKNKFRERV